MNKEAFGLRINSLYSNIDDATKRPFWWLVGILVLWLSVNFVSLPLSPTVWVDEVSYVDPAVSLYLEGEFTTSIWSGVNDGEFWSHNVPGWQLLLYGWLNLFGFSIYSIRAFSLILLAFGALLTWSQLRQWPCFQERSFQLVLLFSLFLFAAATSWPARAARPDSIGLLLFGFLLFSLSCEGKGGSCIRFLFGFSLPWFGLQFIPFFGILVAAFILIKKLSRGSIVFGSTVFAGLLIGIGCLFGLYAYHGTIDTFMGAIAPHTTRGDPVHSPMGIDSFTQDLSTNILFGAALLLFFFLKPMPRKLFFGSLSMGSYFGIPLVLNAVGVYPIYYTWTVYVVLASLFFAFKCEVGRHLNFGLSLLVLSTLFLGVPARSALAVLEYQQREYSQVRNLVDRNLTEEDVVFGHWQTYYALRHKPNQQFYRIRDPEALTLVIDQASVEVINARFGGYWEEIDGINKLDQGVFDLGLFNTMTASKYKLKVFRRHTLEDDS